MRDDVIALFEFEVTDEQVSIRDEKLSFSCTKGPYLRGIGGVSAIGSQLNVFLG